MQFILDKSILVLFQDNKCNLQLCNKLQQVKHMADYIPSGHCCESHDMLKSFFFQLSFKVPVIILLLFSVLSLTELLQK